MSHILIIGYGNPMCGDDAIGYRAAYQLAQRFRGEADVEVIATQQLVPEMAEDISRSQFVLFLDAAAGEPPGTLRRVAIFPGAVMSCVHDLTPASLLAAAEELYGDTPPCICITLAGWSFELGQPLSPGAQRRLPELIRMAKEEVAACRKRAQKETMAGVR